jgi:hypothetical protein
VNLLLIFALAWAQQDAVKSVPKADGQVGVESIQTAGNYVGWLVDYDVPDVGTFAGTLIVWKDGRVVRRFESEQTFWSWSFVESGKQVAYHTGPMHGEQKSHCELHSVADGRLLTHWDGDLESSLRPAWTSGLKH